jgi:hypothetical protein
MDIYLPIAGMSINFFLIIGIGALVGFIRDVWGWRRVFVDSPDDDDRYTAGGGGGVRLQSDCGGGQFRRLCPLEAGKCRF